MVRLLSLQYASRIAALTFIVLSLVIMLFATPTQAATRTGQTYIPVGAITIDGDFSDWPSGANIIKDTQSADLTPVLKCWNASSEEWEVVASEDDCVDSYLYNEEGQMDIQDAYFGLNKTNMYVGLQTAFPMFGVLNTTTGEYHKLDRLNESTSITHLPQDFDHTWVLSFGEKGSGKFDYYLVIHDFIPADFSDSDTDNMRIFKESNDELGWQEEDTFLSTMEDIYSKSTTSRNLILPSENFEVRQNISKFFEVTGMSYEMYRFRLETHSEFGDTTKTVHVNLAHAQKPRKMKKQNVLIKKVKKESTFIDWRHPIEAKTYRMQLQRDDSGTWETQKTFTGVKKTYQKLTTSHVDPGTKYRVRVRPCNDIGCGPWSSYKEFTTKARR